MSYFDDLLAARTPAPKEEYSARQEYVWWREADDVAEGEEEYVERIRAGSLFACARSLETAQGEVHQNNLFAAQLYSNRELANFDWGSGALTRASLSPITSTGENITVRVVDTLVAQIGKNRPKPKPVARGASFRVRQSIKRLDKFLYGEFQRNRVYAQTKQVFRDACIFGFGVLKVSCEEDEVHGAKTCYERVFPDEILVDQMELVATGKIRHLYRRRVLPIEVVAATYDIDEATLRAEAQKLSYLDDRPVGVGWTIVIEGYQVASNGAPGYWCVSTSERVLDEGIWEHEWTPYVFYHWQTPVSGFYSPGVVEQAVPYQIRLNEINEVIRDAQDIMGRPRILVAEGSRINPLEVDNVIGRFIKYTGIKPEAVTWTGVNAELYNERERLVRSCLEHFGLSGMAATATPPPSARFDSSAAFREFNAIQDDRLADPAQRFEEFHLDVAQRTIDVIAASGHNPQTTWYSGWKQSKAETISWEDIKAESESYVMTMEAVSIFSMSPASARDELEKQLAMGLITPEQYRLELSGMDTESLYSLQAAAADDLNRVQELLEAGDFENPIPEQDLVSGITQMTLALLNLNKYEDVPDDTKLNFINWITLARAIMEQGTTQTDATAPDPAAEVPMGDPGMMGLPAAVPVPESSGLQPAGVGALPNLA